MANNIRYARWAAGVLKIIMVLNVIIGLVVFAASLLFPAAAIAQRNMPGTALGITINFGALITIAIQAFMTYTAARALELLADVAYHLLMTWHRSQGVPTPPNL